MPVRGSDRRPAADEVEHSEELQAPEHDRDHDHDHEDLFDLGVHRDVRRDGPEQHADGDEDDEKLEERHTHSMPLFADGVHEAFWIRNARGTLEFVFVTQIRRVDGVYYAIETNAPPRAQRDEYLQARARAEGLASDAIAYDRALVALVGELLRSESFTIRPSRGKRDRRDPTFAYEFGIWRDTRSKSSLGQLAAQALHDREARAVLGDALEEQGHPVVAQAVRAGNREAIADVIIHETVVRQTSDLSTLNTLAVTHKIGSPMWTSHGRDMRELRESTDAFTDGYLEAALWSTTDESDEHGGQPLDQNYGISNIADETFVKMLRDTRAFQVDNAKALADSGLSDDRAGRDFWFNREGHGVGFWSESPRDSRAEEALDALAKAAEAYRGFDLYVGDDGKIHGS